MIYVVVSCVLLSTRLSATTTLKTVKTILYFAVEMNVIYYNQLNYRKFISYLQHPFTITLLYSART